MATFGMTSGSNLSTCERDIQTIFREVIKYMDCSIVEGHRTAERQHHHWKKGRKHTGGNEKKRNNWVTEDSKKIVTTKDGYEELSRHQIGPVSSAVDVVPYPEMWSSDEKFFELAGVVKATQARLLAEGKITTTLDWGADLWNGFDKPHWQTKKA